jgi:hypothetical protein
MGGAGAVAYRWSGVDCRRAADQLWSAVASFFGVRRLDAALAVPFGFAFIFLRSSNSDRAECKADAKRKRRQAAAVQNSSKLLRAGSTPNKNGTTPIILDKGAICHATGQRPVRFLRLLRPRGQRRRVDQWVRRGAAGRTPPVYRWADVDSVLRQAGYPQPGRLATPAVRRFDPFAAVPGVPLAQLLRQPVVPTRVADVDRHGDRQTYPGRRGGADLHRRSSRSGRRRDAGRTRGRPPCGGTVCRANAARGVCRGDGGGGQAVAPAAVQRRRAVLSAGRDSAAPRRPAARVAGSGPRPGRTGRAGPRGGRQPEHGPAVQPTLLRPAGRTAGAPRAAEGRPGRGHLRRAWAGRDRQERVGVYLCPRFCQRLSGRPVPGALRRPVGSAASVAGAGRRVPRPDQRRAAHDAGHLFRRAGRLSASAAGPAGAHPAGAGQRDRPGLAGLAADGSADRVGAETAPAGHDAVVAALGRCLADPGRTPGGGRPGAVGKASAVCQRGGTGGSATDRAPAGRVRTGGRTGRSLADGPSRHHVHPVGRRPGAGGSGADRGERRCDAAAAQSPAAAVGRVGAGAGRFATGRAAGDGVRRAAAAAPGAPAVAAHAGRGRVPRVDPAGPAVRPVGRPVWPALAAGPVQPLGQPGSRFADRPRPPLGPGLAVQPDGG